MGSSIWFGVVVRWFGWFVVGFVMVWGGLGWFALCFAMVWCWFVGGLGGLRRVLQWFPQGGIRASDGVYIAFGLGLFCDGLGGLWWVL